jgi:hypothetical protein
MQTDWLLHEWDPVGPAAYQRTAMCLDLLRYADILRYTYIHVVESCNYSKVPTHPAPRTRLCHRSRHHHVLDKGCHNIRYDSGS